MPPEQLIKNESATPAMSQLSLVADTPGGRNAAISLVRAASPVPPQLRLVFMFPGGGAQYPGMGKELYDSEPVFRAEVDCCAALALKYLSADVRKALFEASSSEAMNRPSVALLALFVTEYALARLWMSLGVQPAAMIGHSLGEYVAACLSGVFSLQDAIYLVILRGALFETIGLGAMLSVPLPGDAIKGLLGDRLSLAAVNAPSLCVVSGPSSEVDRLEAELNSMCVQAQRIPITVPAHSSLLDGVCEDFFQAVLHVRLHKPGIRFVSNVTGLWIADCEATNPTYWVRHFRNTVQFAEGMNTLLENDPQILLEVGPGRTLSSLAKLNMCDDGRLILPSLKRRNEPRGDKDILYSALSQVVQSGFELSPRLHKGKTVSRAGVADLSNACSSY